MLHAVHCMYSNFVQSIPDSLAEVKGEETNCTFPLSSFWNEKGEEEKEVSEEIERQP